MYDGLRGRMAAKKFKSGKRTGEVRREKIDIPYTLQQFETWLRVVLEDTPHCEYCAAPISITTISPDHAKPISRGGTLELANLRGACDTCNRIKGSLLVGEFKALLAGLKTFTEAGRNDVIKRLKGGILHFGNRKREPVATNVLAIPAKKEATLF